MRAATAFLVLLSAGLASTCADPEPEYDCSAEGRAELYEKRIAPLLADERPKSCNQCHLAGVDLELFVRDTPCQTMACMVELGLVNLQEPSQSMVLGWIGRAAPASDGITAEVIAEEREGFRQWIEQSAQCGLCYPGDNPCGDSGGSVDDCTIHEAEPTSYDPTDPGGCDDKTLEQLFASSFFPYRRRCFPCHFEGQDAYKEAPRWISVGDCDIASLETYRQVIERGFIDVDEPSKSRWLLKPLDEALGGIQHGGGVKFHSLDEPAYVSMLAFSERYAACAKAGANR